MLVIGQQCAWNGLDIQNFASSSPLAPTVAYTVLSGKGAAEAEEFRPPKDELKKTSTIVGLVLVGLVMVFAVVSFLRETWAADQAPGAVEQFFARWLLSGARQSQADLRNPFPPDGPHLQEGRELYEKHCAFCHGLDGKGPGENGIQFYPPVPSLVASEMELTDGQMHYIISRGIRYTAMPSFAKVLTPDQIWKVITWVRSLPRAAGTEITNPSAPSP